MLEREARYGGGEKAGVDVVLDLHSVGESGLLHAEVLADEVELIVECDLTGVRAAQCQPEYVAQLLDDAGGGGGVAAHVRGRRSCSGY